MTEGRLNGQVAIVTGGARGLGFAIAEHLAASGARVALFDLDGTAVAAAASRLCPEDGSRVIGIDVDVSSPDSVADAVRRCTGALGPASILVNNAGINAPRLVPAVQISDAEFEAMIAVHLRGSFLMCRAVLPQMTAAGYGRIVNQASIVGLLGFPFRSIYGMAKAGIVALTRTLAVETARQGVTVNAIAPGYILTEVLRDRLDRGLLDHDLFAERTPVGRWGQAHEIARVVSFLADPGSGFITGTVIPVDGGYSVRGDPGENIGMRTEPSRNEAR